MTKSGKNDNGREIGQESIDHALEGTFPASDPPSWSYPHAEKGLQTQETPGARSPGELRKYQFSRKDYMRGHRRGEEAAPRGNHHGRLH